MNSLCINGVYKISDMASGAVEELSVDMMFWSDKLIYLFYQINEGKHAEGGIYAVQCEKQALTFASEKAIFLFEQSLKTSINTRAVHIYGATPSIVRGVNTFDPASMSFTFIFKVNNVVQYEFKLWGNENSDYRVLQCFISNIAWTCVVC